MLSETIRKIAKEIVSTSPRKYFRALHKLENEVARKTNKPGTIAWISHDWSAFSPTPFVGGYYTFNYEGKRYSGGFGDWEQDVESTDSFREVNETDFGEIEEADFDVEDFISAMKFGFDTFKDLDDLVNKGVGGNELIKWVEEEKKKEQ